MEEVVEVDKDDNFIRWVSRKEVHEKRLIHRSVHAFVFHPDGRFLVQLRHRDKQTYPHYWDVSCSGHVDRIDHRDDDPNRAREACDLAITRELEEELGVTSPARYTCDIPPIPNVTYEYARLYVATWDGDFILQETEVEQVAWVSFDDVHTYTPLTGTLRWFVDNRHLWNETT